MNTTVGFETIAECVADLEQSLCNLQPSNMAECEERLQHILMYMRSLGELSQGQGEEWQRRCEPLLRMLHAAARLYAGWIDIFGSSTSGYNAQGDSAVPLQLALLAEA